MNLKDKKLNRLSSASISIVLIILFSACTKFLDKPQNSQQALITTIKDCQAILNNESLYRGAFNEGIRSSDDYYLNDGDFDGFDRQLNRDYYVWGNNAILSTEFTNEEISGWLRSYNKVYLANLALEFLEKITEETPSLKNGDDYKLARGMALFVRGNCHFQTAELYAKPYAAATDQDLGIPYRLTSDLNASSKRLSVKETYGKIIQDIQEALTLLPVTTTSVTRPSKLAAYALLARVYLAMEQYSLAAEASNSALQMKSDLMDFNSLDLNGLMPFPNKEHLFYNQIDAIGSFDLNRTMIIDSILYASYAANDLRKQMYFQEFSPGMYTFKGSYTMNYNDLFVGLATDEMYLVRAECAARAGNTTSAMNDLNTLLRTRWKTGTYTDMTASNADDALAKILIERRKELILRGQRWMDLKRLNKDPRFAVTLKRIVHGVTYTLPPNALRYQLLIPQQVIEIGGVIQNPR